MRSAIPKIVGRKDSHLQFPDPLMGSGRPVGATKSPAGEEGDRWPHNTYRTLIPSWDQGSLPRFQTPRRQCGLRPAINAIAGRILHLWPWLLFGGARKVDRTESATSRISQKKNFVSFFPHKTNKLLNFHIFISDALQIPCSFFGN
jgi:hypothetical protein